MGFSRKFKDGDKVRVIDINSSNYKKVGIIKWYGYPLHIKDAYFKKKIYYVDFKTYSHEFYSHQLEKVEDSNNTNTKSNRLSISNLKPGIKIKIRPDLKEGYNSLIYVSDSMTYFNGTIQTIKVIKSNNTIILNGLDYLWDIDCFSEIIEEPKEEIKVSKDIKLPLKEGQVVTLLDGKQYQVIKNNTKKCSCHLCSLYIKNCGEDRCHITHIKGKTSCTFVIPAHHYFKLYEDQKTEDSSSESINSIEKDSSIAEVGIITKVNFTLTDFKSEELKHSKFTVL